MNLTKILTDLRTEKFRLEQAIAAIESLDSSGRRRGRPAAVASAPKKRHHRLSAAARKKIAAAQRARWAKVKAAQKKSA